MRPDRITEVASLATPLVTALLLSVVLAGCSWWPWGDGPVPVHPYAWYGAHVPDLMTEVDWCTQHHHTGPDAPESCQTALQIYMDMTLPPLVSGTTSSNTGGLTAAFPVTQSEPSHSGSTIP